MPLEIRRNRAENTHENFQFRRIAEELVKTFERFGWDGLLIGNPESENFSRFRADAILLYNHGLIIIDLKDYQGTINLPKDEQKFKDDEWYIDLENDKERIIIKAGKSFRNPFKQLQSYRSVMFDVVNYDIKLSANVNPGHICALNLFSGPIQLSGKTPGNLRYYNLVQESNLSNFLEDYTSGNCYSKEIAEALNRHFPTPIWTPHNEIPIKEQSPTNRIYEIEHDVEQEIKSFLDIKASGILVLESMEASKRDEWGKYILSQIGNYNIPQAETWTHSTRIRRKIKIRSGIAPDSLYTTIYGGPSQLKEEKNAASKNEDNSQEDEVLLEEIPIRSADLLDDKAIIILQDAHLVSRSLHQSELLRFGSGRLMEDLIKFLALDTTQRKLICIGDPFSLSYGKAEESAIALPALQDLFDGEIKHYRAKPIKNKDSDLHKLRVNLASSIDNNIFNQLEYSWNNDELVQVAKNNVLNLLEQWFSKPLVSEPKNGVLLFSNELATKTNLWIKNHCLKNSSELSQGDLLMLNNNVHVPDETGFENPTRLYNGMYLIVKERLEEHSEILTIGKKTNQQITLNFIKLRVACLSLTNNQETYVWLNENYFKSSGKLSKEEQIAFRILVNKKIGAYKEEHTFETSLEYKSYQQDSLYGSFKKQIRGLDSKLERGERVKTKLDAAKADLKRLERKYKRKYNRRIMLTISSSDPYLNSINASYGWCITVHKSVGSQFDNIIINATQGENNGVNNANYFRWLYSGLTTSLSNAYVSNPIEIDPFMNCHFDDTVTEVWQEVKTQHKNSFEFNNFVVPTNISDKISSDLNENAKAAICLFSETMGKEGFLLERTQKSGDYASKAFFSTPNNEGDLRMVFNNNGKGLVTSVRPEANGEAYMSIIENAIFTINKECTKKNNFDENDMPIDFRQKIYTDLIKKSEVNGYELKLISCNSYQDVFLYSKDTSMTRFKLIYNGQGLFTFVKVLNKTDANISKSLYRLIFECE